MTYYAAQLVKGILADADNLNLDEGFRRAYIREKAIDLAVEIGDAIIMETSEGSREETDALTAEVAHRWSEKALAAARSRLAAHDFKRKTAENA